MVSPLLIFYGGCREINRTLESILTSTGLVSEMAAYGISVALSNNPSSLSLSIGKDVELAILDLLLTNNTSAIPDFDNRIEEAIRRSTEVTAVEVVYKALLNYPRSLSLSCTTLDEVITLGLRVISGSFVNPAVIDKLVPAVSPGKELEDNGIEFFWRVIVTYLEAVAQGEKDIVSEMVVSEDEVEHIPFGEDLSSACESFYRKAMPTCSERVWKILMIYYLKTFFKSMSDVSEVHVYGSSCCNIALAGSDIDLCVTFIKKNDKTKGVYKLAKRLRPKGFEDVTPIRARASIVTFRDPIFWIPFDVSINNEMAVLITEFLNSILSLDLRANKLVILIKLWAEKKHINSSKNGYLSSLGYTLLCISFLQRCNPPVLPFLLKGKAPTTIEVQGIEYGFSDMPSDNKSTENIGSLVHLFFKYYGSFDFSKEVVSVRSPTRIRKTDKKWQQNEAESPYRHNIAIESPFNEVDDVGQSVLYRQYTDIYQHLKAARDHLDENHSLANLLK